MLGNSEAGKGEETGTWRRWSSGGRLEREDIGLSHPLLGGLGLLDSLPADWPGLIHMGMPRFQKKMQNEA